MGCSDNSFSGSSTSVAKEKKETEDKKKTPRKKFEYEEEEEEELIFDKGSTTSLCKPEILHEQDFRVAFSQGTVPLLQGFSLEKGQVVRFKNASGYVCAAIYDAYVNLKCPTGTIYLSNSSTMLLDEVMRNDGFVVEKTGESISYNVRKDNINYEDHNLDFDSYRLHSPEGQCNFTIEVSSCKEPREEDGPEIIIPEPVADKNNCFNNN